MVRKQVARRNAVDAFAPGTITGTLVLIAVFTFAFSFSHRTGTCQPGGPPRLSPLAV
jgi:hypothetical protein